MITTGADDGFWARGSWSGTPNLDIVSKKIVVKALAVKGDAWLSCVAVHDEP